MQSRLAFSLLAMVPTVALAQPASSDDPADPNPQANQPPPVVIVNPPPPAPVVRYVEPEYETYTDTWNAPLFTSGAIVFLGSYGASVVVAAMSEDDEVDRGNDRLYVPVLGPWLALDDRPDCPIEQESCDMETTKKVLLVADGVLQAGGVATMIAGLLSPTEHRIIRRPAVTSKKVRVSPSAGGHLGLSISGAW